MILINDNLPLKHYWPTMVIILIGLLISLLAFLKVSDMSRNYAFDMVKKDASASLIDLKHVLENKVMQLATLVSFFESSNFVSAAEFKVFVRKLFEYDKNIIYFSWIAAIKDLDIKKYQDYLKHELISHIPNKHNYFVEYIEPLEIYGAYQYQSLKVDSEIYQNAINVDFNNIIFANQLDNEHKKSLFILMPTSKHNHPWKGDDYVGNRDFVMASYNIKTVITNVIGEFLTKNADVSIMYKERDMVYGERDLTNNKYIKQKIGFGFTLYYYPKSNFVNSVNVWLKWIVLLIGIIITILLVIYSFTSLNKTEEVSKLVEQRTNALSKLNKKLEHEIEKHVKTQKALESGTGRLLATNRELKLTKSKLIQSDKLASIGHLAAGVAHEINNPVGYINSNLSSLDKYLNKLFVLIDMYSDAECEFDKDNNKIKRITDYKDMINVNRLKKHLVDIVKESREGVDRVKKIVQDLKDFSRVDEEEWQWSNICNGIDSTLNIVNNEVKYKADVVKEYTDIPLVLCVPSQINQIVMNLLVNAAQAIEGHGKIIIRAYEQGACVYIDVEDNGPGIPNEIQDKIFDPFFTTKEIGKGTGLGLSLSYGIISKHKGELLIDSKVGHGAKFTIKLPVNANQGKNGVYANVSNA